MMSKILVRILFSCLLLVSIPTVTLAQSFTVSEIYLENLQRVSSTTIFSLINVNIGDEIGQADFANIIRDLMATGFFNGVEVLQGENQELIINVEERPSIASVELEGNDTIPEEVLMENLVSVGLAVGELFNPSVLESMQIALESQYVSQGLYGALVDIDIQELDRNRVAVQINITEGDPSKIVHINIVGNEAFSDEELLELFELKESHLTSFFLGDDRYSREQITGDLENLESYYRDQGYVNFVVTLPVVSLSPDRSEVYITINIFEGEVYRINDVSLAGDLVGSEDLLTRVMSFIRPGQVFSQILITQAAETMNSILSNRGYFFAEVNGVPIIDEENGTVDVTFIVVPGNRTYVNRISFSGNRLTVDEVLRQEMRQMENAPASVTALEQSKVRLERLGFFSSVEYETNEVGGVTDQIDINYTVEEQSSGSINFGVGYAQVQGLTLSANLQESNFLGTGNLVGIGVNTSDFATNYSFNFTDPYYTVDGVSRSFGISYSSSDFAELNLTSYGTDQFGVNVGFGYPINEIQNLNFSLGFTNTKLNTGYGPVQEILASPRLDPAITKYIVSSARTTEFVDPLTNIIYPISDAVIVPLSNLPDTAFRSPDPGFIDIEGDKFNDLTLTASWGRNNLRQQGMFARGGDSQNLSVQLALPGSDMSFYRVQFFAEKYIPLNRFIPFFSNAWNLHLDMNLGYADAYGSSDRLPFFRNFYAGGLRTVRGFRANTLGPRSTYAEDYLTQYTELLKDTDGNFVIDASGNPIYDTTSERGYILTQAEDANGDPVFDATGQPVFIDELFARSLYVGRAQPFGGNIQAVGTAEIIFPFGFMEDQSRLRSSVFIDGGNVFSSYCTERQISQNNCSDFSFNEFRYSAGISVSWFTGIMGIMTFSLAKPFNNSIIDETETFQFDVGTSF
jgi:outer membrane protein insertion porin family